MHSINSQKGDYSQTAFKNKKHTRGSWSKLKIYKSAWYLLIHHFRSFFSKCKDKWKLFMNYRRFTLHSLIPLPALTMAGPESWDSCGLRGDWLPTWKGKEEASPGFQDPSLLSYRRRRETYHRNNNISFLILTLLSIISAKTETLYTLPFKANTRNRQMYTNYTITFFYTKPLESTLIFKTKSSLNAC